MGLCVKCGTEVSLNTLHSHPCEPITDSNAEKLVDSTNDIFSDPAKDAERVVANKELLIILKIYLEDHPCERFSQALRNLGIVVSQQDHSWVNEFNLEPTALLDRVKAVLEKTRSEK
jgi:hypothetical protein